MANSVTNGKSKHPAQVIPSDGLTAPKTFLYPSFLKDGQPLEVTLEPDGDNLPGIRLPAKNEDAMRILLGIKR